MATNKEQEILVCRLGLTEVYPQKRNQSVGKFHI